MNKMSNKSNLETDKRYYLMILISSIVVLTSTALLIMYGNSNKSAVVITSLILLIAGLIGIVYSIKKLGLKITSVISNVIKALPLEIFR